ncbi:TfoX/Sxy family protein, partial [Escherichia coli]
MDAEDLRDIFRSLGPIHIRRMFGGQGVYQGEVMFALV